VKLLSVPDTLVRWRRRPAAPPASPATSLIADVCPQSWVVVTGMIRSTGTVLVGSCLAYHFTLVDGSGELDVLFLGWPSVRGLRAGTRITVEGRVGTYACRLALRNPRYRIEPAD
jgi:hypothetical protein